MTKKKRESQSVLLLTCEHEGVPGHRNGHGVIPRPDIWCERMRAKLTGHGCLGNQAEALAYQHASVYATDTKHLARWDKAQKCPKCERWAHGAQPDAREIKRRGRVRPKCIVEGCEELNYKNGRCYRHWLDAIRHPRERRNQQPCDCGKPAEIKGLCRRCYNKKYLALRRKRNGKPRLRTRKFVQNMEGKK